MYLWGPLSVTTEFSRNCIVKTVRDQEERGEEVSIWLCILSCFRNLTAFWLVSKYLQYRRLIFGPLSSLVSFTLGTGILALRRTKNVAVGAPFHTNNINAFKSQRNRRFYRRQWRVFFFVFFFLHAYRCCRNCEYCVDHPAILWGTGDDSGGTLLAEAHQNIGTERPIVPQREGWQRQRGR